MSYLAKLTFLSILIWLSSTTQSFAQNSARYLVLFKDKAGNSHTLSNPSTYLSQRAIERRAKQNIPVTNKDLPVSTNYIAGIKNTGVTLFYTSRWFNGAVIEATSEQIETILGLPFVAGLELNRPLTGTNYYAARRNSDKFEVQNSDDPSSYGNSYNQLNMLGIPSMHDQDIKGQGILIAILDSGFPNANTQDYLSDVYAENRVVDTFDFVTNTSNVYDDHNHGLMVMSTIAANKSGALIGAAPRASFALYRTENAANETPFEEVTWLAAAERADSLGADIINTSLGYYSFDDPTYDYSYADMNGKTTIISRAAQIAARTGMLLVNSAGNEGNNSWKYITAPADVDSVLTVGAIHSNGSLASFSSIGPNADGVIKPDVVALGTGVRVGTTYNTITTSQGTSFSGPLIAGLAALHWQKNPTMKAQDLHSFIRSIGNLAHAPTNTHGYGLPNLSVLEVNSPNQLTAKLTINVVNLKWEYSTMNDATFEVERSFNGQPFVKIASTLSQELIGDTLLQSGNYQYRIRAVTDTFKSRYSNSVDVQLLITGLENPNISLAVYPKPATDQLYITNDFSRSLNAIQIIDLNGRTVKQFHSGISGKIVELPIADLLPGVYYLRAITNNGHVSINRIIKL